MHVNMWDDIYDICIFHTIRATEYYKPKAVNKNFAYVCINGIKNFAFRALQESHQD